jgi:modulator of drug activity B
VGVGFRVSIQPTAVSDRTKYMLSLTLNAPKAAFDGPNQWFFEGKGLDDLFWPMHLNFKFFGMKPMETFACFDVMKNPDIENDFIRFEAHLNRHFGVLPSA